MYENSIDPGEKQNKPQTPTIESEPPYIPGQGSIGIIRFFAWLDLLSSIGGAIWIWVNYHEIELNGGLFGIYTEPNPIGIASGFAVLLQGIFVFTLFLVIAAIAENVIEIRKKLGA